MMLSGFPDISVGKELACNAGDPGLGRSAGERDRLPTPVFLGFPCGSAGKESACNAGDPSSIPGLGRSPREGIGYPHQYSWASLVAQLVKKEKKRKKVKSLSRVGLFVNPWTVAYKPPLSMGFSRQEYWSGLPFQLVKNLPAVQESLVRFLGWEDPLEKG